MTPLSLALLALAQEGALHWPQWRGPTGDGVASGPAVRSWSDGENLRWKVEVPGRGMSTPIVVGEALFLTTAVPIEPDPAPGGEEPEAEEGRRRGPRSTSPEEQSFELHCLDRKSGATRWKAVARVALPHEGHHLTYGSYASASPVSDGKRVYVSFGSRGLYAYGLDGTLAWSFDPGLALEMRNHFGEGLSPVLAGDVLVQVADQEKGSCAFGLDKETGKELWRVARNEPSTWATPLVTSLGGRLQVVTGGVHRTRSYDPATGQVLWEAAGAGVNAIPAVARHEDLVLVMSGYRDAKILALAPVGAEGEPPVRWSATKGCSYTSSPVLCGGLYYTVTDAGRISCFDAASGQAHYLEQRLPRGSTTKASPIAAGEFLYVPTESGEVHLVRLGKQYEIAGTNALSEQMFIASPAYAEGALYLRSVTHLVCVADD